MQVALPPFRRSVSRQPRVSKEVYIPCGLFSPTGASLRRSVQELFPSSPLHKWFYLRLTPKFLAEVVKKNALPSLATCPKIDQYLYAFLAEVVKKTALPLLATCPKIDQYLYAGRNGWDGSH